jgi:hypothetical protein
MPQQCCVECMLAVVLNKSLVVSTDSLPGWLGSDSAGAVASDDDTAGSPTALPVSSLKNSPSRKSTLRTAPLVTQFSGTSCGSLCYCTEQRTSMLHDAVYALIASLRNTASIT